MKLKLMVCVLLIHSVTMSGVAALSLWANIAKQLDLQSLQGNNQKLAIENKKARDFILLTKMNKNVFNQSKSQPNNKQARNRIQQPK